MQAKTTTLRSEHLSKIQVNASKIQLLYFHGLCFETKHSKVSFTIAQMNFYGTSQCIIYLPAKIVIHELDKVNY